MKEKKKTKVQFKTTDALWKRVLIYRIRAGIKTNSEAVEQLIRKGLAK